MRWNDRVAIVTGGGSGFGAAICGRFAEEGAKVILVDCRADRGEAVGKDIGAIFVEADVASDDDARRMIATAVERFGRLDIVVNNAGAPQAPTPVTETETPDFDRLM